MNQTYVVIYDKEYSNNIVIKKADCFWTILSDVLENSQEISRKLCVNFPKLFLEYLRGMASEYKSVVSYLYGFNDGVIYSKADVANGLGYSSSWVGEKANYVIHKVLLILILILLINM